MSRDELTHLLVTRLADATDAVHRLQRERMVIRDALTALRCGRDAAVVAAQLAADRVEVGAG